MSLNLIEEAIEKIAKEKDHTARNAAITGAGGAVLGAGAAKGLRHLYVNRNVNNASKVTESLMGSAIPDAEKQKIKELLHKGIKQTGVLDTLKDNFPISQKIKFLAMKKRVMAPAGAALAGGAYLLSRKNKDK